MKTERRLVFPALSKPTRRHLLQFRSFHEVQALEHDEPIVSIASTIESLRAKALGRGIPKAPHISVILLHSFSSQISARWKSKWSSCKPYALVQRIPL